MWLRRKAKIAQNMWQGSTFFFKNCYSWKFEFQWRKICSHLLKKDGSKSISKTIIFILKISNLEGLAYLLKTGCQWRLLPEYYGARQTIYYHFRTLVDKDVFSKIKQKLLEIKRIKDKRKKSPSIAVIDSQSVRSGLSKSEKGIDGNKKIKGIKRHVCVDSAGLARNYEQFLQTAQIMAEFACMMLLLKYI